MLGTNAPAAARKKKASVKDATTDANWSIDRDPIRILVDGLRRRATNNAVTMSGRTMPRPRKKRLPRFQRL